MVSPLIGIHAAMGEIGIFSFLWVFVELINPITQRIKRAKIAALTGFIFILFSWVMGGYYYVDTYGASVKPIIKEGPTPWAHGVFMETKEHIFLFLPFLALLVAGLIYRYGNDLTKNNGAKQSILMLCALIVILGLVIAGMGYLISSGARNALEGL